MLAVANTNDPCSLVERINSIFIYRAQFSCTTIFDVDQNLPLKHERLSPGRTQPIVQTSAYHKILGKDWKKLLLHRTNSRNKSPCTCTYHKRRNVNRNVGVG